MNALLTVVLTNAVLATGLFVIVFACKSRIRNPAVLHVLWILVLLKMLTPPLWNPQWALLPAAKSTVAVPSEIAATSQVQSLPQFNRQSFAKLPAEPSFVQAQSAPISNTTTTTTTTQPVIPASFSPMFLIVSIWATGTFLLWGLSAWRISKLRRYLRFAQEAPADVQRTSALLAGRLGLQRSPRVLQVPGRVSPMIWAFAGPAKIVVPTELFNELDDVSRQTLLLHELAHYRRGDQWIRWLELLTLGLYWWHPVAWLVRREIRLAEELACDACVVSQRPDDRRAYAEMLVSTVAFLSADDLPALATGVGTKGTIEERLRNIMSSASDMRVTHRVKLLVGIVAILFLPLAPILVRAQRAEVKTAAASEQAASDKDTDKTKTTTSKDAPGDDLQGTVVDENGKPVTGIEVTAFFEFRRVDRVIRTDDAGRFRIPRSWHSGDVHDSHATLLVKRGDSHLGWLDLGSRLWDSAAQKAKPASTDPFRLVLLPLTQVIQGTLVSPDGAPLSDVRLAINGMSHPDNRGINKYVVEGEDLGSSTTDQQGKFVVRLPVSAQGNLEPHHPDWQRRPITFKADTRDLGRITMAPAGRIQGRVVDAVTGKPLAGQRVFAQARNNGQFRRSFVSYGDATSDQNGHYVIGGLSPSQFNVLFGGNAKSADSPSLTAVAVEGVDVIVERPAQADFQAFSGRTLRGKVLDSQTGMPVEKIHVGYYGPARPNSGAACLMVRTKADGTFEFRVPPGVSKVYVAEGDRRPHTDSSRMLEVATDRDLLDVVLRAGPKAANRGVMTEAAEEPEEPQSSDKNPKPAKPAPYKLRVKLQTPAGRKINSVEARVVHKGSQHASMWTALSATGYQVSFHEREEGLTTFLLIYADGYAAVRSPEFVVGQQMPELEVQLVPEQLVPVRGSVFGLPGQPVAGARVRIARHIYGTEETFPWGLEYTTGADGQFEIKHVRAGDRIQVRIDKAGTGGAESAWLSLDGKAPVDLPVMRVGSANQKLGGLVRDFEGFPVTGAKVSAGAGIETTTDAEGKFLLAGLPIGKIALTIESPGFPRSTSYVESGKLNHEIHVNRIRPQDETDYQVAVTLRPRDGGEVSKVAFYFGVDKGPQLMSMPERKGNSHKIGFASFVRRHQGKSFVLVVAAEGYARPKPIIIPNQRGPDAVVVDLDPAAPITLHGRVVDEAGQPVADAKVGLSITLHDEEKDEHWRYLGWHVKLPATDANGKFEVPGILRNSDVAVYINKPGYSGVWSKRVLADKPDPIEWPDLRLTAATGELSGVVVDEQGRPVADAVVSANDIVSTQTSTDAQGRFRLQQLPNKEILLWVRSESGQYTERISPSTKDLAVKLRLSP